MKNQVVTMYKNITLNNNLMTVTSCWLNYIKTATHWPHFLLLYKSSCSHMIHMSNTAPTKGVTQIHTIYIYKNTKFSSNRFQNTEDTCKPHPWKTALVHKVCASDHKARLKF